jgi:hypothetical protein
MADGGFTRLNRLLKTSIRPSDKARGVLKNATIHLCLSIFKSRAKPDHGLRRRF